MKIPERSSAAEIRLLRGSDPPQRQGQYAQL